MEPARRKVELPAAIEEVWDALTRSDLFSQWFGTRVELQPRPGGRATFRSRDGGERIAVVEVIDPPTLLVLRFQPFERDAAGNVRQGPGGHLRFVLRHAAVGTLLEIEDSTSSPLELSGITR